MRENRMLFEEAGAGNVIMGAGLPIPTCETVGFSTGPYRRRASARPYRMGWDCPMSRPISRPTEHTFCRCAGLEPEDLDAESASAWDAPRCCVSSAFCIGGYANEDSG